MANVIGLLANGEQPERDFYLAVCERAYLTATPRYTVGDAL
jgi:hypothetical protein